MPQGPPCDCERVPAGFQLDCKLINDVWRMMGGVDEPGTPTSPVTQTAPLVFPQPFKLEIVQACDIEDPDLRPYVWDCP